LHLNLTPLNLVNTRATLFWSKQPEEMEKPLEKHMRKIPSRRDCSPAVIRAYIIRNEIQSQMLDRKLRGNQGFIGPAQYGNLQSPDKCKYRNAILKYRNAILKHHHSFCWPEK